MIALSAPHRLWLAGEDAPSLALISAAYRAAGCEAKFTVSREEGRDEEAAVVEWLTSTM